MLTQWIVTAIAAVHPGNAVHSATPELKIRWHLVIITGDHSRTGQPRSRSQSTATKLPAAAGLEPADEGAHLCVETGVRLKLCKRAPDNDSACKCTRAATERPTEVKPRPMEL